jgi:oligoribonuclease
MTTNGATAKYNKWKLPSVLPPSDRLVWVDCEMSGLDLDKDVLLEIAMIVTEGDTLATVAKTENIIIHADDEVLDNMGEWCVKQHGKSGLTQACRDSKISVEEAETMLLKILQEHTPAGKCPLAGNTVSMDRIFIAKYMPTFHSHLHYRNVDVSSIKEMARRWYPDDHEKQPKKHGDHRALGDIEESIKELQYYKEKVFKK